MYAREVIENAQQSSVIANAQCDNRVVGPPLEGACDAQLFLLQVSKHASALGIT